MRILDLEKEQILELLRRIITHTNVWSYRLEQALTEMGMDEKDRSELSRQMNEEFGRRQARGLVRMGLIDKAGIDAVIQALSYSHWAVLENLQVEKVDEKRARFGVIGCTTIKALEGTEEQFDCHKMGPVIRQSFIQGIVPEARVSRLFTPGGESNISDAEKDPYRDYSCLWEVTLP